MRAHKGLIRVAALFVVSALFSIAPASAADKVIVTTLDWPPYTGPSPPKEGATTEVVRQAFSKAGLDVEIAFLP